MVVVPVDKRAEEETAGRNWVWDEVDDSWGTEPAPTRVETGRRTRNVRGQAGLNRICHGLRRNDQKIFSKKEFTSAEAQKKLENPAHDLIMEMTRKSSARKNSHQLKLRRSSRILRMT
ncbi:hypothetical protein AXG93_1217s1530 [Marchantia polymorpha subsp. ruderalis]|uniref:Uncharacterized protein n=1 Tax=Marchantia polymorpha subsp. ruderalis TaxID=1480154 RepID=A0A176VU96_MARPO|nr:hypothetical protein AXG93_1217s1530 [Marchantia polymorpha subsp. ruderalis]